MWSPLAPGRCELWGQPARDDLDQRALGAGDVLLGVGQPPEHPAGEELLDRAVEDVAREARVEVGPDRAVGLATLDDLLDRGERLDDLVHLAREVLAARHLEHEHAYEIGVTRPRAQQDLRHLAELLARGVARLLDAPDRRDQRPPRLAEDGQ